MDARKNRQDNIAGPIAADPNHPFSRYTIHKDNFE